ncbi:DUF3592 domain-containing protein [Blastopirellula sp. JC732]|uniref:DUF3592 domain-containing protein n=1 Tax=Blastopirellula sediminis TaxID=2894196 RepID=A0A9X1MGU7_9BACT|nr:DUF3592 domain-containing protein [Blastopirellula sediminis]MCC9626808.1 DUF3592 domain-containing protein [Blastopirellula sediminis]
MSTVFFALFISIFYIVGFAFLGGTIWIAWHSLRAGNWPTTPATITDLDIISQSDGEGGDSYEVKVAYTYEVLGKQYEGSRLAYGYGGSSGREAHQQIFDRLQNANAVAVRYDPGDPAQSCLSYGIHRSIQIGLAFAATWLLFVFGFTLLFWLFSLPDTALLRNLSAN